MFRVSRTVSCTHKCFFKQFTIMGKINENGRYASYSEESLKAALSALKRGVRVTTAARDHGIPRSTLLYQKQVMLKPKSLKKKRIILGPDGKPKKQSYAAYTEESLQAALAAVRKGVKIAQASEDYGIPKTTLLWKHQGVLKPTICKRGPDTILGQDNERILAKWVQNRVANKLPITRDQLLESIRIFLDRVGRKTIFRNNRPGRHWIDAYRDRHNLADKITPTPTNAKTRGIKLKRWFREVKSYLQGRGLLDIDGSRVFHCHELALLLNPKDEKSLIRPGDKTPHSFSTGDPDQCISTMMCGNAAGELSPPLTIFNCSRVATNITAALPDRWAVGRSDDGWVNGESFYDWMKSVFHPWLIKKNIQLPIVFYLDGYKTHFSLEFSQFCSGMGIVLVSMPMNVNEAIPPMDSGLFQSVEKIWYKAVRNWRKQNGGKRLKRENFCTLLDEVIRELDVKEILSSAFERVGFAPFSIDSLSQVDYYKDNSEDALLIPVDPEILHSVKEVNDFLSVVEYNIGTEIMETFEDIGVEGKWNGPVEHEKLFYLWQKIKSNGVIDNLAKT